MKNKYTKKSHRLNINLTDGEYYTLQNLANYYHMTVSDYVKKACNILGVYPQTEFIPFWDSETKTVELIDNTPEGVKRGYLTLREYYKLEEECRISDAQSQWELEQAIARGEVDIDNL